ncbi:MAG TPA: o-succinylbenzoate synthase [Ktedonobacteraceae bacterium]|nr:o-succinylbenzoate synthase [Ktedonobacteraceae bacterium]
MNIAQIRWWSYRIPFRHSFTTAHGTLTAREGIIVQVDTVQGVSGFGEIAPLPSFSGGSLSAACSLLSALAAHLAGITLDEALALLLIWGEAGIEPAPVLYGLECALLDVAGKAKECAVSALLSPAGTVPRTAVEVNAVIGAQTTEEAVIAAREVCRNGFHSVKLKVGLPEGSGGMQEEVGRVAAVREALGPAMHLRLDANEGWTLEEAIAILTRCIPYNIQYVEQPLPALDLAGLRALRQAVPIPVAADEALHGPQSARPVLESEAADILIIKPQLAGGLRAAQMMMRLAAERGAQSVITSTIETGIGLVAALHLAAASPTVTLACGLATLPLLVDDLVMNDLAVHAGLLALPAGSGFGVMLDREAAEKYSIL